MLDQIVLKTQDGNLLRDRRRVRCLGLWLVLVAAECFGVVGCIAPLPIAGEDHRVFSPAIRVSLDLSPPLDDAAHRSSTTAEVEYAQGSGNSSQPVLSGDTIAFDGRRFDGPVQVDSDFTLRTVSTSLVGGVWVTDTVGFEVLGGLGLRSMELALSSGGVVGHDRTLAWGPRIGGGLRVRATPWLEWFGRVSYLLAFGASLSDLTTIELAVQLRPAPRVALVGGWRRWQYYEDRGDESAVDDLVLSGPTAAIQFFF